MTMKNKEQEQLLSSYFDNEVSPAERAEIERLLESSTETQQSLQEIGQLADLIRSLPKQSAPENLPAAVMQQAKREMLHSAPSAQVDTPTTGRQYAWFGWVGGLISTAALLFVGVHFYSGQRSQSEFNATAMKAPEVELTETASPLVLQGDMKADEFHRSVDKDADKAMLGSAVADASPAPENLSMKSKDSRFKFSGKGGGGVAEQQSLLTEKPKAAFRDNKWGRPQIGDTLRYDQRYGEQVRVIEVTVVDVQEALGVMQLLLARNDIPDVTLNVKRQKRGFSKKFKQDQNVKERKTEKSLNQQPALFVKTTEVQLAAAITDLQKRDLFLDVQPQATQIASVDFVNQLASVNTFSQQSTRRRGPSFPANKQTVRSYNSEGKENPTDPKSVSIAQAKKAKVPALAKPTPQKTIGKGNADTKNIAAANNREDDSENQSERNRRTQSRKLAQNSYQIVVNLEKNIPSPITLDVKKTESNNGKKTDDQKEIVTKKSKQTEQEKVASAGTPALKPRSAKAESADIQDDEVDAKEKDKPRQSIQQLQPIRVLFVFTKVKKPTSK